MEKLSTGTPAFRRTNLAFFAAGFNTFAILYSTQSLLPVFTAEFGVSPATASLSLSLTTITLAVAMLVFGSLSEVWGRKPIMVVSMLAACVICVATAFSPDFTTLLVLRALTGVALAGLPSIAMAYLSEEVHSKSLGAAMGLYICGNATGAVFGRVFTGVMTDWFNWHVALGAIGVISLLATVVFSSLLAPSRHFQARTLNVKGLGKSMADHLRDPGLLCLFGIGFLLLGSNVVIFNYMGYLLVEAPYSLSQTAVSALFLIMLVGLFSSVHASRQVEKHGRFKALVLNLMIAMAGTLITLEPHLISKWLGVGIFIYGFFASHSIASSWVGARATKNKSQASSLYLFLYYGGSSVAGTLGGYFWTGIGWLGVVGMITGFLLLALWLAFTLHQNPKPVVRTAVVEGVRSRG